MDGEYLSYDPILRIRGVKGHGVTGASIEAALNGTLREEGEGSTEIRSLPSPERPVDEDVEGGGLGGGWHNLLYQHSYK